MDLENRNIPKDAESGPKRPPTPDWCERCERNEPRRFCRWCQRHVCTEQCWVADSERARRCHECIGAGESAGETECVRDPVKRSDGDTHVSSSCSWSELPAVQDELPEVLEREALSPFRFNPHAAPFFRTYSLRINQRFSLEQQTPYQQKVIQELRDPSRLLHWNLPYCQ